MIAGQKLYWGYSHLGDLLHPDVLIRALKTPKPVVALAPRVTM